MKVLKIAHNTPKPKMIMLPPDRLADLLFEGWGIAEAQGCRLPRAAGNDSAQ
jgi:hypothetical protein